MSGFAEGTGWTAGDTFFAFAFGIKEAVSTVILIGPGGRSDPDIGDDGTAAHRLSFRGDEPITETESTETCRISRMSLLPVGGKPVALRGLPFPVRGEGRDECTVAGLLKRLSDMACQSHIGLFPEVS